MPDDSVLVVDDSPTILKLVQLVLTKGGYRVTTASSGEAGLVLAHEDPPALILLDYLMPDMNGDDVCRAMSADTLLCNTPVIVMSARDDHVGEHFARMPNVVDHITKPFSPDALLAVIGHVLERHAPASAEATVPPPEADDLYDDTDNEEVMEIEVEFRGQAHASGQGLGQGNAGQKLSPPGLGLHAFPRDDSALDSGATTEPALSGDLGLISIADVLTLLQDQAQTGTLTLAQAEARIDLFLRNGRIDLASARGVPEEFLLGRFLVESRQLTPGTLAAMIDERRAAPSPPGLLGAQVVARGLVTADGLRQAISLQTAALVYEGLRWGAGRFRFRVAAELPPVARDAALALPVDALIMEGLRRVDEWGLIEREIGDFDMVFVRNEEKLGSFGRGKLLRDEVAVLEFVNGKNSVKDIIVLSKMGSFDVTKMLYRLLRNKLIRRRVRPVAV
jgi:CheY-like chemotaxis protein